MPKGMFTQGVCLLTNGQTSLANIRATLTAAGYRIARETPAGKTSAIAGPSIVLPFREASNGYVAVGVVNQSWPDSMGDPRSDPTTFAAWSMGFFGPYTFPGGLARALDHCWTCAAAARPIVPAHRGFVRMQVSYVLGADDQAPVLPPAYDPLPELLFLTRLTTAALKAPGVLGYFNPGGEVLRDPASFTEFYLAATEAEKLPLQLWSNVRFYNLNSAISFMDTVGNAQLDIPDVEALFPIADYDPGDVDYYLRNVTHYLLEPNTQLHAGEPIDGPGETNLSWQIETSDNGLLPPPRRTVRLFPTAHERAIRTALANLTPSR